jgi:hypothetical protein
MAFAGLGLKFNLKERKKNHLFFFWSAQNPIKMITQPV